MSQPKAVEVKKAMFVFKMKTQIIRFMLAEQPSSQSDY